MGKNPNLRRNISVFSVITENQDIFGRKQRNYLLALANFAAIQGYVPPPVNEILLWESNSLLISFLYSYSLHRLTSHYSGTKTLFYQSATLNTYWNDEQAFVDPHTFKGIYC